ncbi:DUF533 domain-containing protein [Phaeovulum vinaykumarii]|uniref:Uncharacterized protein n=1 Tax=Phaeovulum vinaykumarii TaxID=407234 RepID=A0A1N7L3F6_9RHOB|nr:DUF533 domain-containing protein [Phaeovulum vinaykumarii]SIS68331.1 Protein of unknown function [Phaeovulum vinaykumarii]SOC00151.1 uncharacterized protein DUF533 [Phaeovulum vinaykumarii]
MSFMKTLATVAVGFAAAKGAQKFKEMGGIEGMKTALAGMGEKGGLADQMGAMAEKMGVPGGADAMRNLMAGFGQQAAGATEGAQSQMEGLMAKMTGATAAGAGGVAALLAAMSEGTPVAQTGEETAKLMIRAMIQAARADGVIDAQERATLIERLKDAEPEEMAFVEAQLVAPVDPAALAADTPPAAAAQVYASALMAVRVDSDAERAFLHALATGLNLDATTLAMLHATHGVPTA